MEDKQKICDLLLPALQATTCCKTLSDLKYMALSSGSEYVIAAFKNNISGATGCKWIDVTMDSGIEMIRDIVRGCIEYET